jgi:hypothetical protein
VKPGEKVTRILVYHGLYGCETGCCGHWVEVETEPGGTGTCYSSFEFDHPDSDEDLRVYARGLAEDFLRRYHPECLASIDWSTLQITDGDDSYPREVTRGKDCVL